MLQISDDEFQQLINRALQSLPGEHARNIQNVAILYEDEPTPGQREKLRLSCNETLLGLYEGVPLTQRQGATHVFPDKITLFKGPLIQRAGSLSELQEEIRHTLWHEIGHYYGLNHDRIHKLEGDND